VIEALRYKPEGRGFDCSGFGGLVVSMLASGTQDRGSLPTEAVGFFRLEKFTACLPSEGEVK
jgi:hypothetical protein